MSASNTHKHAPPKNPIFYQVFTLFIVLKFYRTYLLEKNNNTRISQFTKPTTSTNNLNSNSNNLNFNMDTLFREFSEIMDDANDKMPEGTYLALYNKLKELKDASTGACTGYSAYRSTSGPYQSSNPYQSGGDDDYQSSNPYQSGGGDDGGSVYQSYQQSGDDDYQPSEPNYQPSEPSYQPSEPSYQPIESAH